MPDNTEVYEIEGPFFFGVANKFEELQRGRKSMAIRIIRMRRVNFIDATGVHNLEIFIDSALKAGQTIILSGVNPDVKAALVNAGIVEKVGTDNVLDHIHKALARAEELNFGK